MPAAMLSSSLMEQPTPANEATAAAMAAKNSLKWERLLQQHHQNGSIDGIAAPTAAAPADGPSAWRCRSIPPKVKLAVREGGIPPQLRPLLWLQLSGAADLRAAALPNYYPAMVRAAHVHELPLTQLEADLGEMWAANPSMHSRRVLESVRRIVMAYALRNQGVGYSHHTGGLAFFLLAVLGADREEDAFWVLAGVLENVLPPAYFEDGKGSTVEQRVFVSLLAKKCPRAVAALARVDLDPGALAAPWFDSLFTKALPAATAARAWDWLLAEGAKVLLRVALALFKLNEAALAGAFQQAHAARALAFRVSRLHDAGALGKAAFKGIGSLSMVSIQRSRASLEDLVSAEIEARRRRIAALCSPPPGAEPDHAALAKRRIASEPSLNAIVEEDSEECDDDGDERHGGGGGALVSVFGSSGGSAGRGLLAAAASEEGSGEFAHYLSE